MIKIIGLATLLFGFSLAYGEDLEKIKVTGSHIKRINMEGASPITVIDREQLDFSGFSSLGDVLRNTNLSSSGVSTKAALADNNGGALTSLRGLPQGYILYLLNGRRLPTDDLNLIPMSIVDRIEVSLDGASALYGSDAIGGVINFITREDVGSGATIGGAVHSFKGGEEVSGSAYSGFSLGNASGYINLMYRHREPVFFRDREFARLKTPEEDPSLKDYSDKSYPGNVDDQAIPGCDPKLIDSKGSCMFDATKYMQYQPRDDYAGFLTSIKSDAGDDSQWTLRLIGSYENSRGILAAPVDVIKVAEIPASIKQGWPAGETFSHRALYGGERKQNTQQWVGGIQTGFESYISDTWDMEAYLDYNIKYSLSLHENYFDKRELFKLWEAHPSIFVSADTKLADPAKYKPRLSSLYQSILPGVIFTGEVLETSLATLSAAIGARGGFEKAGFSTDSISWDTNAIDPNTGEKGVGHQFGGGVVEIYNGSRYYGGAFTELSLPFDFIEFNAAGSVDYYQYAGLSMYPEVSVKFYPVDFAFLRASYNKGYKAPIIEELFLENVITHYAYIDYNDPDCKLDEKQCESQQYKQVLTGNKNLKPQKSDSYNVGFVFQPFDNFSLSTDYFRTEIKGIINAYDISTLTKKQSKGESIPEGNDLKRNSSGKLEEAYTRYSNARGYKAQGLDLKSMLQIPMDEMTAYLRIEHQHFLDIEVDELFGYKDRIGHWGYLTWKNTAALGLEFKNKSTFEISSRGLSSYNQKLADPDTGKCRTEEGKKPGCGTVPAHFEFDLAFSLPIAKIITGDQAQSGTLIVKLENLVNSNLFSRKNWKDVQFTDFKTYKKLLDANPPTNRERGTNQQKTITDVSSTASGYVPNGFYSTNGRTLRLSYLHTF